MATTTATNAIFLEDEGKLAIRQIKDKYKPEGSQSLVKVDYSAINPADIKHFYMGLWGSVAGYEWTGSVIKLGETSPFKLGQQLFGFAMYGARRPVSTGAHQDYLLAEK